MKFIVESCRIALARYNCHEKWHSNIIKYSSCHLLPTLQHQQRFQKAQLLRDFPKLAECQLLYSQLLLRSASLLAGTLTLIYSTRSYSTLSCSYSKLLLLSATLALSSSFSQQLYSQLLLLSATLILSNSTVSYSYSQQLYCQLLLLSATLLSAALHILVWHSQKAKPSSNTIWYIHIYFQGVIFRTTNANLCQAACRSAAQMAWTSSQIEMKSKTRLYLSIF